MTTNKALKKTSRQIISHWQSLPSNYTGIYIGSAGKYHLKNGKEHNANGPAIDFFDGAKHWYINGMLHRIDGPAIMVPHSREEHWLNSKITFKKTF